MTCFSLMSHDHLIMSALQREELTDLETELLRRFEQALAELDDLKAKLAD